MQGEKDEILTKTVVIHFFPNSWDLNKKVTRTGDNGKEVEELYDPNVAFVVEEIGKLAGQYGAARIVIEGHTDASMRGQVPKSLVQELSLNRANSVKEALVRKFPTLQPNQFSTAGHRLGPSGRRRRTGERGEEPPGGDQGVPGRVDRREVDATRVVPSLMELRHEDAAAHPRSGGRGDDGRSCCWCGGSSRQAQWPRSESSPRPCCRAREK